MKTALNRPIFNEDYDLSMSFMHIDYTNVMFNAGKQAVLSIFLQ